jgi:drug/metabolite transporter (DMT)-like permease
MSAIVLSYTTTTIFKSAKQLCVMIAAYVFHGQSFEIRDYILALAMGGGIAIWSLADHGARPELTPSDQLHGMAMIFVSLVTSAAVPNLQQRCLQGTECRSANRAAGDAIAATRDRSLVRATMMLVQYSTGVLWLCAVCVYDGELSAGIVFLRDAQMPVWAALCAYIATTWGGVRCILELVRRYDATMAAMATNVRRAFTLAASQLLFPKPFTRMHVLGLCMVLAGARGLQGAQRKSAPTRKVVGNRKQRGSSLELRRVHA